MTNLYLPPEVFHLVCTLLDRDGIKKIRLVSKALAAIGACHLIPDVHIKMTKDGFKRLRAISEHPIISKSIKTFSYAAIDLPEQHVSLDSFKQCYTFQVDPNATSCLMPGVEVVLNHTLENVEERHAAYENDRARSLEILTNNLDRLWLDNILPTFIGLNSITVAHWMALLPTVTSRDLDPASTWMQFTPLVDHQVELVLSMLCKYGSSLKKLRSLRALGIDWKFFDRAKDLLQCVSASITQLTTLELEVREIATEYSDEVDERYLEEAQRCRETLESGIVPRLLRRLPRLTTFEIQFTWRADLDDDGYLLPASLNQLVPLSLRLEGLIELSLGGFDCERGELMAVLDNHKASLQTLKLKTVRLNTTSWIVLLEDIRQRTSLESVQISGILQGQAEDGTSKMETWHMWSPLSPGSQDRTVVLNDYCCGGPGWEKCPLVDWTMYHEHV